MPHKNCLGLVHLENKIRAFSRAFSYFLVLRFARDTPPLNAGDYVLMPPSSSPLLLLTPPPSPPPPPTPQVNAGDYAALLNGLLEDVQAAGLFSG